MTDREPENRDGPGGSHDPARPGNSPWAAAPQREVPDDRSDADALRQRGEPLVNLAPAIVFFLVLMGTIHLVRSLILPPGLDRLVLYWFAFIPEIASYGLFGLLHQLWAAVTYSLLHGSWPHFFMNGVWLAIFGSPLALRMGTWPFVLFWIATAFSAAAFHFAIDPFSPSILVGASGAISGMMGAATRLGFRVDRHRAQRAFAGRPMTLDEVMRSRAVVAFIVIWLVLNLITGLFLPMGGTAIAWQAHIGGFVAGFFLLPLFPAPGGRHF